MMSCKIKWHFLPRMEYKAQVKLDNLNNRVTADQYKNKLDVKLRSLCRSMETNFEKETGPKPRRTIIAEHKLITHQLRRRDAALHL